MIIHTRLDAIALATATGSAKQPRRATIIAPQRAFEHGEDRSLDPSPQYDQQRLRRHRKASDTWIDDDDEVVSGGVHCSRNLEENAGFTGVRKFRRSGRNAIDRYRGSEYHSGHRRIRTTA